MVKYQDAQLDRVFAALSDPTRRGLLARLGSNKALSVSELAGPLKMSLPAVMKHLDVLADAGLLEREKTGRTVTCEINADPMRQAMDWLTTYQQFWSVRLDQLANFLETDAEGRPWPTNLASPSSVVSTRRRKKSSRRGRDPIK